MQAETVPMNAPDTRSVYRASLKNPAYLRLCIVASVFGFVVYTLLQVLIPPHHSWREALITGALWIVIVALIRGLLPRTRSQLVITPEAFEYCAQGRCYWAFWSDVDAIARSPWYLGAEGLRLRRRPYLRIGSRLYWWQPGFVPLAWFAGDWRNSLLGDEVHRYAPWLFDPAAPRIQEASRLRE